MTISVPVCAKEWPEACAAKSVRSRSEKPVDSPDDVIGSMGLSRWRVRCCLEVVHSLSNAQQALSYAVMVASHGLNRECVSLT